MELDQWALLDEQIYVCESNERYLQYAGLRHSEKAIARIAELKAQSASLFLDSFSEPRELYLASLENIADSAAKDLELEFYKKRNQEIVSSEQKWAGSPVNWSTWRQFNSSSKSSVTARKQVFDEFISKTRHIAPVIEQRFNVIRKSYKSDSKGKVSPLAAYLETERISFSELDRFVKMLGLRARKPFQDALHSISTDVLRRQPDYYDDFYFFRNVVFADFEKNFSGVSPVDQVRKTLEFLGFDLSAIKIDAKDRKNKYPSPICFFVKIPSDVRVLYKSESAYFDLQGCFHEMGHAVHATSIGASLPYSDRYHIPMGIAEIFSIFLERLCKDRNYLSSVLGIRNQKVLDKLEERNRFMELFFLTFYSANSLMKAEFWKTELDADLASDLYGRLIKYYTGLEMPGEYWMLHHILPDAVMYVPSYLLAAVRAAELEKAIKGRYGEKWWESKESGAYLREIMQPGAGIDLTAFSKLDAGVYLGQIGVQ